MKAIGEPLGTLRERTTNLLIEEHQTSIQIDAIKIPGGRVVCGIVSRRSNRVPVDDMRFLSGINELYPAGGALPVRNDGVEPLCLQIAVKCPGFPHCGRRITTRRDLAFIREITGDVELVLKVAQAAGGSWKQ